MTWWLAVSIAWGQGADARALDPFRATVEVAFRAWRLISLADGPRCPMRPTCSGYAVQAIRRDGPLGIPLVTDRLIRDSASSSYPLADDHEHRLDPLRDHARVVDLLRGCRAERRAGAGACTYGR